MSFISVEIVYALPDQQQLIEMSVSEGTTALQLYKQSKLEETFPEISKHQLVLGVFGEKLNAPDQYILQPGDRIEVYRPLTMDPKLLRKRRAEAAT